MTKQTFDRRTVLAVAGTSIATAFFGAGTAASAETAEGSTTEKALSPPTPEETGIATELPTAAPQVAVASLVDDVSFARPPKEQKLWDALVSRLHRDSPITSDSTVLGHLSANTLRVESGFSFVSQNEDVDFHPLHIEPLLDQAADLLDRCLRDRSTYDDLAAKSLTQILELLEYSELDEIHKEEEQAGVYELPFRLSTAESEAQGLETLYGSSNASFLRNVLDIQYSDSKRLALMGADQLSAWLQGLVPYYWQGQSFSQYGNATWNGTTKPIYDHYFDAGVVRSHHNVLTDFYLSTLQWRLLNATAKSASVRAEGPRAQQRWDSMNASFLKRRTLTARRYHDLRLKAATELEGVLNYGKRLDSLRERFHNDFRDALARLRAAQKGLAVVYGYDIPLPSNATGISYYDDCLLWVRNAIQWLIRFARREQNVVIPFSLKTLIGDSAWKAGRKKRQWYFDLRHTDFPELAHVRLRGLSATVEDGCGARGRLWRLQLQVPDSAEFLHATGAQVRLDQSDLPVILLGRVVERDFPRDPDIVGVSSLHNASPVGRWTVSVLGAVPQVANGVAPDDIYIDLHLAFRRPALHRKAM